MSKTKNLRPGERASSSGIYKAVGTKREVTVDKGERMPPGTKGTHPRYHIVRKAKHKGG
jgi:hypothetical protein